MFDWKQDKEELILKTDVGSFYFIMPSDWDLKKTHPDLLFLAEWMLLSPFYPEKFTKIAIEKYAWSRKQGTKIGLSFSTGVDSTAALSILPEDTALVYHQRDGIYPTAMKQNNALRMIENMKRKVHIVKSNHESIGENYKKGRGFSTDLACGAGLILLADYLDLGYFATGTILGSTYVAKGEQYRKFEETWYWPHWSYLCKLAGLELMFPVACLSEVLTNKIVQQTEYKDYSLSCIRGVNGKGCGYCYKCFRKNLLNGTLTGMSNEVLGNLKKPALHQGDALIYAYQKSKFNIPQLEKYKDVDVSWSERYYSQGLNLVNKTFRKGIEDNLKKFNIKPMTEKDIKTMEQYNIR